MHAESHYYTRNYGYFFFNQDIFKKTAQKFTWFFFDFDKFQMLWFGLLRCSAFY